MSWEVATKESTTGRSAELAFDASGGALGLMLSEESSVDVFVALALHEARHTLWTREGRLGRARWSFAE